MTPPFDAYVGIGVRRVKVCGLQVHRDGEHWITCDVRILHCPVVTVKVSLYWAQQIRDRFTQVLLPEGRTTRHWTKDDDDSKSANLHDGNFR